MKNRDFINQFMNMIEYRFDCSARFEFKWSEFHTEKHLEKLLGASLIRVPLYIGFELVFPISNEGTYMGCVVIKENHSLNLDQFCDLKNLLLDIFPSALAVSMNFNSKGFFQLHAPTDEISTPLSAILIHSKNSQKLLNAALDLHERSNYMAFLNLDIIGEIDFELKDCTIFISEYSNLTDSMKDKIISFLELSILGKGIRVIIGTSVPSTELIRKKLISEMMLKKFEYVVLPEEEKLERPLGQVVQLFPHPNSL